MGDNGNKSETGTQELQDIKLIIVLQKDGNVYVEGPMKNEPLALWLLDKAKDIIKAFNIQQVINSQPRIEKPHGILNFARKKF